jgi:anhydro-N-acetylmuramic acid kinase
LEKVNSKKMVYRVAGILNKGTEAITIAFIEFEVSGKNWSYQIVSSSTYNLSADWQEQLKNAASSDAAAYLQLHAEYGKLLGNTFQQFAEEHQLDYKIQLIACPGLSVFEHLPYNLGDGAAVAAITGINTVSDFFAMHAALGSTSKKLLFDQIQVPAGDEHAAMIKNCFFAVLRWREENNFLVDGGASRNSIGGAVWIGQEW